MERLEVLNKSKELVEQIYENMRTIETCDAVAESIKDLELCFSDMDNKQIVSMEGVLSLEQQKELRETVIDKIYSNASKAQGFLERLYRKPATINPKFEFAVQNMVQSKDKPVVVVPAMDEAELPPVSKMPERLPGKNILDKGKEAKEMKLTVEDEPVPPKPSEILEAHVAEIEKLYKVDMATVGSIAEKYGVKKTDVNTFLAKHKLFRKAYKKDDVFLDSKAEARAGKECL